LNRGPALDVETAANDILAKVPRPQPEPRRLRRAATALKGFLLPRALEAARQEVRDLAPQGIDQLKSAL
jgi:hypothetical protein